MLSWESSVLNSYSLGAKEGPRPPGHPLSTVVGGGHGGYVTH